MWYKKIDENLKNKKQISHNLTKGLNIILILFVLNSLSNNFGMYDYKLMLLFSIYLLVGFVIINTPIKKTLLSLFKNHQLQYNTIFGLILIISTFFIFLFSNTPILWISSIPLLIIGLILISNQLILDRKEMFFLFITSQVYCIFYIFLQTIPQLWTICQQFSLNFTDIIGQMIGGQHYCPLHW